MSGLSWQPIADQCSVRFRSDDYSLQYSADGHPMLFIRFDLVDSTSKELVLSDFNVLNVERELAKSVFEHAIKAKGLSFANKDIRLRNIAPHASHVDVVDRFDNMKSVLRAVFDHLSLGWSDIVLDHRGNNNFDLVIRMT